MQASLLRSRSCHQITHAWCLHQQLQLSYALSALRWQASSRLTLPVAGAKLASDIKNATSNGTSTLTVAPGVYRIDNDLGPLTIHNT